MRIIYYCSFAFVLFVTPECGDFIACIGKITDAPEGMLKLSI
jgi:hypothetical protein